MERRDDPLSRLVEYMDMIHIVKGVPNGGPGKRSAANSITCDVASKDNPSGVGQGEAYHQW